MIKSNYQYFNYIFGELATAQLEQQLQNKWSYSPAG